MGSGKRTKIPGLVENGGKVDQEFSDYMAFNPVLKS